VNVREDKRPLALVTGASRGIGFELARRFAVHGFDVVINAEDEDLWAAAQALRETGARIDAIRADLRHPADIERLWAAVQATGRPLRAAALNAGVGRGGAFVDIDVEDEIEVVDLNIVANLRLAKPLLRDMVARDEGALLITSSIAASMPGSYHAVYNASKSFLQSFGQALSDELRDSRVTVTVVMPGPTETAVFRRARMGHTKVGTQDKDDPAQVAEQAFDALMRRKRKVVVGSRTTKAQAFALRVLPDRLKAALHRRSAAPGTAPDSARPGYRAPEPKSRT
jgi:uncharacterized protein